jgi:hypothetical protein
MSSALINRIKQKNARVRCKMLDYDQNAPLDIKEIASEKKQGIRINDISYAGFADDRVSAYLVEPPGVNPHAGILAGAERRLKAFVLLAALPSMTELWNSSDLSFAVAMRDSLSLEQLDRYIEVTAPFDVIHHIGKAAPAPLFFPIRHRGRDNLKARRIEIIRGRE